MSEEKKSIFRQETIDRISSPEQLTDYLKVTSPGLWVVFTAIVAMLVGFFVWMSVDILETTVPAGVSIQNHSAQVAIVGSNGQIAPEMTLRVGGQETKILTTKTDEYGRTVGTAEVDLPDGMYEGTLVTDAVHPIQFLISSK